MHYKFVVHFSHADPDIFCTRHVGSLERFEDAEVGGFLYRTWIAGSPWVSMINGIAAVRSTARNAACSPSDSNNGG